jgi:hypothetical protein
VAPGPKQAAPPALQRDLQLAGAPAEPGAEVVPVFVMNDRVMTNLPSDATHCYAYVRACQLPTIDRIDRRALGQLIESTCQSPAVKTALDCSMWVKLPSAVLYRVEFAFKAGFDSRLPPQNSSLECFPRRQRSFLGIIGAPYIVSAYANGLSPLLFQKYARMITLAIAA